MRYTLRFVTDSSNKINVGLPYWVRLHDKIKKLQYFIKCSDYNFFQKILLYEKC